MFFLLVQLVPSCLFPPFRFLFIALFSPLLFAFSLLGLFSCFLSCPNLLQSSHGCCSRVEFPSFITDAAAFSFVYCCDLLDQLSLEFAVRFASLLGCTEVVSQSAFFFCFRVLLRESVHRVSVVQVELQSPSLLIYFRKPSVVFRRVEFWVLCLFAGFLLC